MYKLLTAIVTKMLYNHTIAIGATAGSDSEKEGVYWHTVDRRYDHIIGQKAKNTVVGCMGGLPKGIRPSAAPMDWRSFEIHQSPKDNQEMSATHYPHVGNHI